MTPATLEKREQFQQFIQQLLAPETAVKGVVGIGSIATGLARPDSDIDAVIFLQPYDEHIVPAEAIWDAENDTFHSIFIEDEKLQQNGLQVDFARLDWQQWASPDFIWPEERRAELAQGWIAYDPTGELAQLIQSKTAYTDEARTARLDEAVTWLDQHLGGDTPGRNWESLGPTIAHDRLNAAYYYLVDGLFAFNRRWRVWRNREMSSLLNLPWLPANFAERVLWAANTPSLDYDGYMRRVETQQSLFAEWQEQLIAAGDYQTDPVDEAFIRSSEEPGRAWNMAEWNEKRQARLAALTN